MTMGLTDNSVFWHCSSNTWNRNTHTISRI